MLSCFAKQISPHVQACLRRIHAVIAGTSFSGPSDDATYRPTPKARLASVMVIWLPQNRLLRISLSIWVHGEAQGGVSPRARACAHGSACTHVVISLCAFTDCSDGFGVFEIEPQI